jgi:hypothetical protein
MKLHQTISLNTLIIAALAFSGATLAQSPPTADQAKTEMNQDKKDPLAMQGSGGGEWNTLKGHEKGYLAMADADPNSWLAHNFKNCDKNQDSKVTEDEYTKCQTH